MLKLLGFWAERCNVQIGAYITDSSEEAIYELILFGGIESLKRFIRVVEEVLCCYLTVKALLKSGGAIIKFETSFHVYDVDKSADDMYRGQE
ncbi:MAG: hypothetical protein GY861_21065 [bacterium]|nr:hypothetical protein [bacterium]